MRQFVGSYGSLTFSEKPTIGRLNRWFDFSRALLTGQ
jgi:hypothetical protein